MCENAKHSRNVCVVVHSIVCLYAHVVGVVLQFFSQIIRKQAIVCVVVKELRVLTIFFCFCLFVEIKADQTRQKNQLKNKIVLLCKIVYYYCCVFCGKHIFIVVSLEQLDDVCF
jgi:hypothetical protein